jgi:hypothetical protein
MGQRILPPLAHSYNTVAIERTAGAAPAPLASLSFAVVLPLYRFSASPTPSLVNAAIDVLLPAILLDDGRAANVEARDAAWAMEENLLPLIPVPVTEL